MKRAVFLDRDGVVTIPELRNGRSYAPRLLEQFKFYPEAAACLSSLKKQDFLLFIVTNQPDVGNGLVKLSILEEMHERTFAELPIDDLAACYHRQGENCQCRKPRAGMLKSLAKRWGVDLQASYMVGDRWSDIDAGKRAGCQTIFIDHGYTAADERLRERPDFTVSSLVEAAGFILQKNK